MEDQWTTIDRKTSKKKTSREESKDEGEGWEQVGDTNLAMEIICATGTKWTSSSKRCFDILPLLSFYHDSSILISNFR